MVIAALTWDLSLPGCSSLKEKRSVVRSLKDRLRHKFNVSVAETDFQDVHSRARVTMALVASDGRMAEQILDKADRFVQEHVRAVITQVHREVYR